MSGASVIVEDQSLVSRLDRIFLKLEAFLNLIGGLAIFLIVLLAVANILGRKLFDTPVNGYIDWMEQFMAFFAFLGISYCQRFGGHIRMDIVVGKLSRRWLWLTEAFSCLLMFGISLILVFGAYSHFERAYVNGDSSFDIGLPTWPSKLVVPVMLAILCLRLLLNIWGYLRAFYFNLEKPAAVPMIQSTSEQAIHETDGLTDNNNDSDKNTKV
ncbi:TRAP transporter small permease subunit [Sessilibacter corallicola]|uniref:TRAP transporter small permease protein n=1 Tax=Sessilibacter corallicola TaxID=2904075 RepID=A0ABQ0A750_9GAMM